MPVSLQAAIQAWKEADDAAGEAERHLYAAWHAYLASGTSVPAALQQNATRARALAMRKLTEAVAANKAAAAIRTAECAHPHAVPGTGRQRATRP